MDCRRISTIVRSVDHRRISTIGRLDCRHSGTVVVWFVLIDLPPQSSYTSVSIGVVLSVRGLASVEKDLRRLSARR
jgi:hypothetical protein